MGEPNEKESRMWEFLRTGKRLVNGWLQRVDAEIIGSVLELQSQQSIYGSCVEIGLHHGKLFIPLCMSLKNHDMALGIDVFDAQEKNLDSSGRGDFEKLQENLDRFLENKSKVRIFKGSSEDVEYGYILQEVGPVRFFSVDGGHWKSIVVNDLSLAEKTLARGGVIALDDYLRADWPDVTTGYLSWQESTTSNIVPFAIGSNKLYLCHSDYSATYRDALRTPFLKHYFAKTYSSAFGEVDSYRVESHAQDEGNLLCIMKETMKIFRPGMYIALKSKFDIARLRK